jgi:HSP20 family molecular chaperone IbpA
MIDSVVNNSAQQVDQRRKELEATENQLIVQKGQVEREKRKEIEAAHEKGNETLVNISKEGERLAESLRNQNRAQVTEISKQQEQNFLNLANDTADRMRLLDKGAKDQLLQFNISAMDKVKDAATMAEDPFYRLKSFDATVENEETAYRVNIKLPPHEAKNLFLTSEGNKVKLSLARSFENKAQISPDHSNRTYSYQTILESFTLPSNVDAKQMTREYKDGVLNIRLPKV